MKKLLILIPLLIIFVLMLALQIYGCSISANAAQIYDYDRIMSYIESGLNGNGVSSSIIEYEYRAGRPFIEFDIEYSILDVNEQPLSPNQNITLLYHIFDTCGKYVGTLTENTLISGLNKTLPLSQDTYTTVPDDMYKFNGILSGYDVKQLGDYIGDYTLDNIIEDVMPYLVDVSYIDTERNNIYRLTEFETDGNFRIGELCKGTDVDQSHMYIELRQQENTKRINVVSYSSIQSFTPRSINSVDLKLTLKQNSPPLTILPVYSFNYLIDVPPADAWDYPSYKLPIYASALTIIAPSPTPLSKLDGFDYSERLQQIFPSYDTYLNYINSLSDLTYTYGNTKDYMTISPSTLYTTTYFITHGGDIISPVLRCVQLDTLEEFIHMAVATDPSDTLTNAYNNGYINGKEDGIAEGIKNALNRIDPNSANWIDGYKKGDDAGYKRGLAYASATSPSQFSFIETLTGILSIEILPNFSFSTILTVVIAFVMLGLVIKLLKGE